MLAEILAAHVARQCEERRVSASARCVERVRLAVVDATVDASHEAIKTLVQASLVMPDCHRHQRACPFPDHS